MAYIVNTKIENQTNGYSLDAKNVKGTYVAVATLTERDNLPEATLTAGSLCYCVETSTFYQFDGTDWQVANLGADGLIYKETTTTETINITTPVSGGELPCLAYGNGRLVLLCHDAGTPEAYYSDDDGQTWQAGTPSGHICSKVVFGNGVFVGTVETSERFIYSSDGITWEDGTLTTDDMTLNFQSVAFENGVFMMVDSDGELYSSTDGSNWTSVGNTGFSGCTHIAGGNNKFVVAESTGTFGTYELDGTIIDSSYTLPVDPPQGLTFINGLFVVTGTNRICSSTDGINWLAFELSTPDAYFGESVTLYANEKHIVCMTDNNLSNTFIFSSTDLGETWTEVAELESYQLLTGVALDQILLLYTYFDGSDTLLASTDGINWDTSTDIINSTAYLEQAGTDVTSKVAAIVGGNGGGIIGDEIETLTVTDNLTVSGNFTLAGDFVIGNLEATDVTTDNIIINNTPTEDSHAVTKKYLEEYVENALLNGTW